MYFQTYINKAFAVSVTLLF